ncbi:MAG: hypothetical protein LBP95_10265 [Deltaproteobacteria bacterium]|jgi:hypothetical protein|nr:hypothetical protein [Deltaproteobacteria bacterium]
MKNKNTIEDEIDAIRIELYEQTKHMTPKEFIAFIHKQTAPINEKYGFKPISRVMERGEKKTSE